MKKNLFLRLCLILLVTITIYSCRTDHFQEQETYNNSSKFQLTSKRISLNDAKHKAKLLLELQKAEKEVEKQELNIQGKLVNVGNGITIDTDEVIYMENGPDFHTYTFSIIRDNAPINAPVENLLLTPNPDGSYKVFHIVLNLTEADKAKIANREYVNYKNKEQITELAGVNLSSLSQKQLCIPHYYSYPVKCKDNLHEPGEPCAYAGEFGAAYWGSIVLYDCFGEEPATIMPTPTPINGGGGGGGECPDCPDNNTPVQCIQAPTDPTQVGIVDPNGCVVGMPTDPNLPTRNNPCAKIKARFSDANFKAKVDSIDKPKVFAYDHEIGYAAGYPTTAGATETHYEFMDNAPGTHNVVLPPGNQYFGFIHSHTNDTATEATVKIFSPADVATFLTSCVANAYLHGSVGDAYSMVVTSEGNYMLQYSGTGNFTIGTSQIDNWKSWYLTEFQKIQKEDGSFNQNDVEKLFPRFLKESVKTVGLEVYYVEKNTGKASKLNTNGTKTPCPL
ncbi:hypothetical protein OF897_00855 [Chryseobacterium formosus]|uniref:DUF4329 domain-containing protein n=1 Tax=Chryseobacterium formosus TaxID=1537363 RepID=A0ABT3XJZ8_9FLAO|nr:hypothetical protein [Chryseobacterium formosus]MCX8522472.1 hypothetical protein [Chryseobacterium formosus]